LGAIDNDRAADRHSVDPLSNFARRPEKRSDRYATIGVEPGAAAHVGDERAALVPIAPYKSSGEG
jgi:hypothetical protein